MTGTQETALAPLPRQQEPALGDLDALNALFDARSPEEREADLDEWLGSSWK